MLSIANNNSQVSYIEEYKSTPIVISNYIVYMTTIKKHAVDDTLYISYLVAATECGIIYVIDHSNNKIISKFKIPATPYQLISVGAFDVDYRIHVLTRENIIYTIKNGELQNSILEVCQKVIGMVRTDKSIIVGTINSSLYAYHMTGKKNFTLQFQSPIICIEGMEIRQSMKNFRGYFVSLRGGEVRTYNEKVLLHVFKYSENINAIKFGKFGTDDCCLVMLTETGTLIVKSMVKYLVLEVIYNNIVNIIHTSSKVCR